MKNNTAIYKLLNHPKIKNSGLKQETIVAILKAYNDIALRTLLETGHVELGNDMLVEVVQLTNRVHVLRGTTYNSSRKYKLKLTMGEDIYGRIENYYEKLKEDIQ